MTDAIGAAAVRSLGIDVANLSVKVAVQQAILEDLLQQASYIDPASWGKQDVAGLEGPAIFTTLLTEEQAEQVRALLTSLKSLQ